MILGYFVQLLSLALLSTAAINRKSIVQRYNPTRNASNGLTPMQVGNGNLAFGADVTGLQTFFPFAIMSSWGWKTDALPPGKTMADVENYAGTIRDTHGKPVKYLFGGDPAIYQWLRANPNRVNLGQLCLVFRSQDDIQDGQVANVTENDLTNKSQELDLWTGELTSVFAWEGNQVTVTTVSHQSSDVVGVSVKSDLLRLGRLAIFVDFPWNEGKISSAPFVGRYDAPASHTTTLTTSGGSDGRVRAKISHTMDSATFFTSFGGDNFSIARDSDTAHRYTIKPAGKSSTLAITVGFSAADGQSLPSFPEARSSSMKEWGNYWQKTGFVDLVTGSTDTRANELQRRIILSRYLMKVNEAGDGPPQESGLVNNSGWFGKFHMEMYFWHSAHWALWNNWDLLRRSTSVYSQFLPTSIARAQAQLWDAGARWPKMTDPSGRASPGETNSLLVWQQPHPLVFAEYEYRAFPTKDTLEKWAEVVKATADWMASFAWFNETTKLFDIGPQMQVVSEDTNPNVTRNAAFELAYWHLGLTFASNWMQRLGREVPSSWTNVKNNLAPLPIDNGTYSVYEGIESNFWDDPAFTRDHPALVGLYGWLPKTDKIDTQIAQLTTEKAWTHWNISRCWGWDFPMLALSAARIGQPDKAVEWLLHPLFQFDDIGMPSGGSRVPGPYFPGSGGLLYAVAFMAKGWDGASRSQAPGFPQNGWKVNVEGIDVAL